MRHIIKNCSDISTLLIIGLVALLPSSAAAGANRTGANVSYSPLLISVKDAIEEKRKNPRMIFVDVRTEDAFQNIHIPGSINVPLHFVKTKGYLHNMTVILVSQGHRHSRLLLQAELLNKKGIKTVVLAGGLAAWSQQDGDLAGPGSAEPGMLHEVDPAALSAIEITRFIDVSAEKLEGDSPLFSGAEHVPVSSQDDLPALAALIDGKRSSSLATVLIFNRKGEYSRLENLPAKCRTTLFFLQGGSEGYGKEMLRQQAILEPKSERMKTIGGCSTCPPVKDMTEQINQK